MSILYYLFNETNDFRHEFTHSSQYFWGFNIQRCHILPEFIFHFLREFFEVDFIVVGSLDDFVINVSDVDLHDDIVAEVVSHDFAERVKTDIGAGMSHVGEVIHSRTTHVPLDCLVFQRNECSLKVILQGLPVGFLIGGCSSPTIQSGVVHYVIQASSKSFLYSPSYIY
jgi:hypothetical protein